MGFKSAPFDEDSGKCTGGWSSLEDEEPSEELVEAIMDGFEGSEPNSDTFLFLLSSIVIENRDLHTRMLGGRF